MYCVNKNGHKCDRKLHYGGDKEDRTPDLLHAMQALSQLSYAPVIFACSASSTNISIRDNLYLVNSFFYFLQNFFQQ